MIFNRKQFFDSYRLKFGPLSQRQVDGFEHLLACIERDIQITNLKWAAYMLATTWHETATTMHPIDERGGDQYFNRRYGPNTNVGKMLGNKLPGDGARYHGRGYCQLTGRRNYQVMTRRLLQVYQDEVTTFESMTESTFDLEEFPEQAKNPLLAYLIMSIGMREGLFTGRKLDQFINEHRTNYREARRVINGLDKADLINEYAKKFQAVLEAARESEVQECN